MKILFITVVYSLSGAAVAASYLESVQAPAAIASPADSEPSVKDRTRDFAVKSRSRKSLKQFLGSLHRSYPESYALISQLGEADQKAIFSAYKSGDPMPDIRRQVIKKYATLAEN